MRCTGANGYESTAFWLERHERINPSFGYRSFPDVLAAAFAAKST
jgi:hypothetical protein